MDDLTTQKRVSKINRLLKKSLYLLALCVPGIIALPSYSDVGITFIGLFLLILVVDFMLLLYTVFFLKNGYIKLVITGVVIGALVFIAIGIFAVLAS
jgi:hypothetical protein